MSQAAIKELKAARKLVNKGWNQENFARDAEGVACDFEDRSAVSFCMLGAMGRSNTYGTRPHEKAMETLFSVVLQPIGRWNDKEGRTKDEVLKKFDEAIAALSVKEG